MDTTIRIAGIIKESIVDGPGIRLVVFAQGCPHRCRGCHNPQTHPFEGGKIVTIEEILEMVKKNPLLDGVTFSGGEPFSQAQAFAVLGHRLKEIGMNIMTYTGYTYEYLLEESRNNKGFKDLLDVSDILVDGEFDIEQKNLLLPFRGSENQRVIDMNKTRAQQKIVLLPL
ncbi:MAG: anaerobic ribonucleoside-triphosphate reductase activating protein [Clostridiales bacterium]|nr:anaerobic ribonucleoside-triphosphate reductase activating protein [Clostridiales bacterium]